MPDFSQILSKKVEQAEKPKPLPAGTYRFLVKGHEFDESRQKKTPYVRFNVQPLAPESDVDPTVFDEFGGLGKLGGKLLRAEYYLTDDAMYRLREFLEDALSLSCEGRSFGEVIPEAVGREFLGTVAHSTSQDGKDIYANIVATARAE